MLESFVKSCHSDDQEIKLCGCAACERYRREVGK